VGLHRGAPSTGAEVRPWEELGGHGNLELGSLGIRQGQREAPAGVRKKGRREDAMATGEIKAPRLEQRYPRPWSKELTGGCCRREQGGRRGQLEKREGKWRLKS
jgi:hypothetical protein